MDETLNTPAPAATSAPVEAPASTPAAAPAVPTTQDFLEIKWNNRQERLPLDKAREYAQKGYDYTQKMQDLARQRQEFESQRSQYDQALNEVRTFLGDPTRVEQYLQQLKQQAGTTNQPVTEDELITAQQLQQREQAMQQQMLGYTQQQIAQMRAQFEVDQLASRYTQDLDSHIAGLTSQLPELKAIPRIQQILKEEVGSMGPRNIEEAKAFMVDVARQHAQQIKDYVLEQRKQAESAGAPLARGIEPPAGSAPMPPAAGRYKSISDPGFKQDLLNDFLKISERMSSRG
jgi:hypothetical protein